jgi:hypothetical protein
MLGELLGEGSGKTTALRVLPSEGQGPKLEVSIQGRSKLLGVEGTDMWTYWQVLRPDGTLFGEGQGVTMTADGEVVRWTAQGVGRPTGRGMGAVYRSSLYAQTSSPKLARLNSVVVVAEYAVDENGNYRYQAWEWK